MQLELENFNKKELQCKSMVIITVRMHGVIAILCQNRFTYYYCKENSNLTKCCVFAFHFHTYSMAINMFCIKNSYIMVTVGTCWS